MCVFGAGGGAVFLFFKNLILGTRGEVSVGLVGREQGSIHRLHAGGAGEGSHQPVVYTVHVVDVHTRQESDGVPIYKVQHTDHTSDNRQINSLNTNQFKADFVT